MTIWDAIDVTSILNSNGELTGDVKKSETLVREISKFLLDTNVSQKNLDKTAYEVLVSQNDVAEGQKGGLFFGVSTLNPGTINKEYYFTKGHYHKTLDTGEYYWGISGKGLLLLHYPNGNETLTNVDPGSVLYIPGKVAHRLINIGHEKLSVGAVWQSISGHAYSNKNLFRTHVLVGNTKDYKIVEQLSD